MARNNRFNQGLKLNYRAPDGGSIFNIRVFGIVGQISIKLVSAVKPHLLKTSSAVTEISSSAVGAAKRKLHSIGPSVMSLMATANGVRSRHSKTNVTIVSTLNAKAKRKIFGAGAINIILNLIARLRQKYKPVYPILELVEYPVNLVCTEDFVLLEVVGMPFAGSTVTLRGTFPDSVGNLAQLDDVTLKVYGPGRELLETITPVKLDNGVYSGDYTIPEGKTGEFEYEFSGELGDKMIVGRSSFESKWI